MNGWELFMDASHRVLVATSDADFRAFLLDILNSWRMEVVQARNVAEARQVISHTPVFLVFCDGKLPDGDFTALVATPARVVPPKVVVLLQEREEDAYAETITKGAFDALPIPCQRQDVQWMLIQAMRDDKRKRGRSNQQEETGMNFGYIDSASNRPPALAATEADDSRSTKEEAKRDTFRM
jgi:DNA-binding NtrC family response regulator